MLFNFVLFYMPRLNQHFVESTGNQFKWKFNQCHSRKAGSRYFSLGEKDTGSHGRERMSKNAKRVKKVEWKIHELTFNS